MPQTDEFGYHEVADMSSFLAEVWFNRIAEHGAVKENKKMEQRADRIGKLMYRFYQDFSRLRYKKF